MNKLDCNVISDLLPLYIDEACSEESRKLVDQHLEECEKCRETLQQMKTEIKLPAEAGNAQNSLRRIKKLLKKKYIIFAVAAAAITAACMGFSFCMQMIETPIEYQDAKVSVVQNKKEPSQYDLVFNGQQYGCLYGEFINLKEDDNAIYQAEVIHTVSTPWTRIFQRKPFKNAVMDSYSADPDAVDGSATDDSGKKKYFKTVAVYYQATPADDRRLLWMADWFQDMKQDPETSTEE